MIFSVCMSDRWTPVSRDGISPFPLRERMCTMEFQTGRLALAFSLATSLCFASRCWRPSLPAADANIRMAEDGGSSAAVLATSSRTRRGTGTRTPAEVAVPRLHSGRARALVDLERRGNADFSESELLYLTMDPNKPNFAGSDRLDDLAEGGSPPKQREGSSFARRRRTHRFPRQARKVQRCQHFGPAACVSEPSCK